jgi:hypothetical protein
MKKVIQASSSKPSNEMINSSVKQPWETWLSQEWDATFLQSS